MVSIPELKSFGQLGPGDFDRHPVWVNVHTVDYDEPWYDECDEETFRPHSGTVPIDPDDGMFLVAASATLPTGRGLPGFLTPVIGEPDPGQMQPYVFIEGRQYGFWGGMVGVPEQEQSAFHVALGLDAGATFPIRFEARAGLSEGTTRVDVTGWLKWSA